jgi:transposase
VRIPSTARETARDLVRTREAAPADMMLTRHRLSKLLAASRDRLLRRQGADRTPRQAVAPPAIRCAPTQSAFEDSYEAVVLATALRARLDGKIIAQAADSEFSPLTRRLHVSAAKLN